MALSIVLGIFSVGISDNQPTVKPDLFISSEKFNYFNLSIYKMSNRARVLILSRDLPWPGGMSCNLGS